MLALFRRHLILTVFTLVAIILVLIGWWVRPKPVAEPTAPPIMEDAVTGSTQTDRVPEISPRSAPGAVVTDADCEIPPAWLARSGGWSDDLTEERLGRAIESAQANYITSRNENELVFGVLLTDQDGTGIRRYIEEIDSGARSPYLVWKAVDRCFSKNGSGATCPREQWLTLLTQLDSENSEAWIRLAGLRFNQGNDAAGLAALERAANATGTNDYYGQDLQNIVNGVEASGEFTRFEAARVAFGLAATDLPATEYHYYACSNPAITDVQRIRLCEQYVANVRSRPLNGFTRNAIERIDLFTLQARGKVEEADALQQLRDRRRADVIANVPYEQARELFEGLNPDLSFAFLNDVVLYGEIEALRRHKVRLEEAGFANFRSRCGGELTAYSESIR